MLWSRVALAAAALGFAQAQENGTEPDMAPSSDCHPYHIFVARGSDEPYPGRAHKLLAKLCTGSGSELYDEGCGYEDIIYPANSSASAPGAWCLSASKGAEAGQRQMTEYAQRCSNSSLLLVGYSQGGAVVGDILGGTGGPIFDCEQPESPRLNRTEVPGSKVAAVLIFGSVKHTANETYNLGTASHLDGVKPREGVHLEGLRQYADVIRDYCNGGDPICAVDTENVNALQHWNYFDEFTNDTASWLASTAREERNKSDQAQAQAAGERESGAPRVGVAAAAASPLILAALVSLFAVFT